MRRIIALMIAAACLAACRPYDTYTGEPYVHMEYTIDGQHYVFEDWGHLENVLFGSHMSPDSYGGGLKLQQMDINESVAFFELETKEMVLRFASNKLYFIDGMRYEYSNMIDAVKSYLRQPEEAIVTGGWFSLTRHTAEPYCRYDVLFELHAWGADREYDITDGIVQVGRRFQDSDITNLIKTEGQ